jgi:predicted N-acyltransferase
MSKSTLTIRVIPDISEIPAKTWDNCANPSSKVLLEEAPTAGGGINPFVSHAFLSALEKSKSATARTGWQPQHLVAQTPDKAVVGVVPCYLKSHSRGEYVFDGGWADAYERAGGSYYPKVQVSVPFTPATGPRLLVPPGPQQDEIRASLLEGLKQLCAMREASSVHITFMPETEAQHAQDAGYLQRTDQQFHWANAGYATFDDFLADLASRKRKLVKRERRDAVANGIEIVWLTGSDITEDAWDAFFAFYMETGSRKWGRPYLTREFYSLIGQSMADRILLVMAKRAGRFIAGAINFIGSGTLFGRHWGAIEHHPFLHFEVCYYQAIAFAIAHKLARVEAGAQGEHKLSRGYLPATTYSAHYIADPAFRRAIDDYLARERGYVEAAGRELDAMSPFRKDMVEEDV